MDCQGNITALSLPSLQIQAAWSSAEIIRGFGNLNRSLAAAGELDESDAPVPVWATWWSLQSLAVALSNGAFLICSYPDFGNRLGGYVTVWS